MGQISYPILNRFGYTMYWDNMWDSLHYYNRFFLKSLFFNFFFFNFFNFYLTLNYFFLTKDFCKNANLIRNKYKLYFNMINLSDYLKINIKYEKNLNETYPGKIWISSINKWYIVSIFLYNSVFEKKTSSKKKPLIYLHNYIYKIFFLKNNINILNKLDGIFLKKL